jgi:hypothetical protein
MTEVAIIIGLVIIAAVAVAVAVVTLFGAQLRDLWQSQIN